MTRNVAAKTYAAPCRYNPSNDGFHCYCNEDTTEEWKRSQKGIPQLEKKWLTFVLNKSTFTNVRRNQDRLAWMALKICTEYFLLFL